MKTIQITNLFLGTAFFAVSLVSCQKDPQPSIPTGTYTPSEKKMAIQDNGLINASIREMQVVFASQNYSLSNSNGVVTGTGAEIKVKFFSNVDGIIPSGDYTYATTAKKLPFTFTDATMQISDNSVTNGVFVIYNGTVTINSNSSAYDVIFNGLLSNGDTFSATYNGSITYSDNF